MNFRNWTGRTVVLVAVFPFVPACSCSDESSGPAGQDAVGDPCVPCDEFSVEFSGNTESGAQLQYNAPMCGGGVCMSKHFRGRVTCPFGNPQGGSKYEGADQDCRAPGSNELVTVPVAPQCAPRKDDVYCTCQCDGADPSADYCKCPVGFSCQEATRSLDPTLVEPGSKFCVRDGDAVTDGYTCPAGQGCDEVPDRCGYASNSVSIPGEPGECGGHQRISTQLYRSQKVDKIDLLFMIDNSASMGDKQKILAAAVPDLVERLTNPVCVEKNSREYVGTVAPGANCRDSYPGSEREFDPIHDIHIGVITSSLGGHGADSCSQVPTQYWNATMEDMARLITRGKDDSGASITVDTYQGKGFLNWDPTGQASDPPGENDVARLKQNFTYMIRGADQVGCGFEASLESWRRFLVDPTPYERMVPVNCPGGDTNNNCRGPEGLDQIVLQQRKDFLRQDSLLSIIMLSDENDCSVIDGGQFYLPLQALEGTGAFHVARSTNACNTDPWSEDCKSCWEVNPSQYPECDSGWSSGWDNPDKDDPLNLRCYEQKRRFGIDFLYPIRRYIDALSEPKLDDGTLNPVFCNDFVDERRLDCSSVLRDPSRIVIAGIVGVPWQDVANDPTDLKKGYRPVEQLAWTPSTFEANGQTVPTGLPAGKTLWNMILGEVDEDPGTDWTKNMRYGSILPTVDPLDPLMKESVTPRTGTHPATGAALVQPGVSPVGHPVNGAEWNITASNDLQYACVFELGQFGPLDCALPENAFGCDCNQSPENPLCWNGSAYGKVQYRAKAYPGRRQLAVLKGLQSQAVVASICPSNMTDLNAADFGYRPAIGAIVDRLKGALVSACWDQQLETAPDGTVPCVVLEATRGQVGADGTVICTACTGARSEATADQNRVLSADPVFEANGLNCVCQINQAEPGPALDACVSQATVLDVEGWCYVDPNVDSSHNPDLVAGCPVDSKRIIRFVGENIPQAGALTFVQCVQGGQ